MGSGAKWTIVANPVSGKGKSRTLAVRTGSLLTVAGVSNQLLYTTRQGDAEGLARKAVEEGSAGVLACGGDGTLHEVINGVMSGPLAAGVTVGIIPAGRCNDFAAALGLPKTAEDVAKLITAGKSKQIDLGKVGNRYFATVATLGFDSAVSQYVADGHVPRFLSGTPSYVYAIFAQLLRYKDAKVHLTGEGLDYSGRVFLTATANTPQYGGNMKIAPGAEPEDGMLDVCLVKSVSRREVVMILPRVFSGGHLRNPAVSMHRLPSLHIETEAPMPIWADGERVAETPAEISVVPKVLNLLA